MICGALTGLIIEKTLALSVVNENEIDKLTSDWQWVNRSADHLRFEPALQGAARQT